MTAHGNVVVSGVWLFIGCWIVTGPSDEVRVQIDKASLDRSVSVAFTVENRLDVPILVSACGGKVSAGLEQWSKGWDLIGGARCPANVSMVPIRMGPRDEISGRTNVNTHEKGWYRVVISYGVTFRASDSASVRSIPFLVQ